MLSYDQLSEEFSEDKIDKLKKNIQVVHLGS